MINPIVVIRQLGPYRVQQLQSATRMTFVIVASLAIIVSLPRFIRALEQSQAATTVMSPVSPLEIETPNPAGIMPVSTARESVRDQMLADFLAKRYRVSKDALERFVGLAHTAGQMTKVDPLLILAVMAVESSFNPIAESVMGAKGLMQIIPAYHKDKFKSPQGTELNVLDPETNILAGAKVLQEYVSRTGQDLAAALRMYGGIGIGVEDAYSSKVLSERERLEQIARRAQERSRPQPVATAQQRT